jgi:hypothetical protein
VGWEFRREGRVVAEGELQEVLVGQRVCLSRICGAAR